MPPVPNLFSRTTNVDAYTAVTHYPLAIYTSVSIIMFGGLTILGYCLGIHLSWDWLNPDSVFLLLKAQSDLQEGAVVHRIYVHQYILVRTAMGRACLHVLDTGARANL